MILTITFIFYCVAFIAAGIYHFITQLLSFYRRRHLFLNYANQELDVWLKPNNLVFFIRWLKPTAIDIDDHLINCRLL